MNENQAGLDLADFQAELGAASLALQEFAQGPARRAANDVGVSFERAGERIARALGRAASDGEGSFKRLAKVILDELAKLALDRIFAQGAAQQSALVSSAGGAFNAGGVFAGGLAAPTGAVSVHFHLGAGSDANAIGRHQGQIAASVARAVAYGRRNL